MLNAGFTVLSKRFSKSRVNSDWQQMTVKLTDEDSTKKALEKHHFASAYRNVDTEAN